MITLAMDIGGTKLAAALVDSELKIIERREIPTPASKAPDALEAALSELVTPLYPRAQHFAIASTGIIQEGVLTSINPANLGGLSHFPLVKYLSALTGLPGVALNDAQAAALAEYQHMPHAVRDMVFITVSTGVGGGVVHNGKLVTGSGGLTGHCGHILADPNGPRCGCGRIGCVEAIASGRGIAAAAEGELCGLDAKAIFAQAAEGHAQAVALIARSARTLARLIADLKALTDCQRVVIGGSIGLADGYLSQVQHYLAQEPGVYQTELCSARHRGDAGLLGAALWAKGAWQ
ncbi:MULTISPECIES: N-acetylmannosamine kinase [unclassified Leclercia]|uniref:N-acetylmannosamine kinase n=1 Tax=Leclercia barmai TaxID=2785629 RepID=A0ABS7RY81_9ENTR|nr:MULTISPECIES: N-acetylmannosamine kinase [unclassified Leclercia]MBZ0058730.1 N-acetylmannosamine kinase [Leclercia sp. EMC7]MCM5696140.1 N-acetylmannosamine kinase [Leclercia sp. LTM01]MCM5702385.1 N-acetylmannosamine kinase [Leclercia sp. LTM14]